MDVSNQISGEKYLFQVKNKIGSGGNGQVFCVRALTSELKDEYVVKFYKSCKDKEKTNKRYKRFIVEVNTIINIENKIEGVLPIIDFHLPNEYSDKDKAWYIMPIAKESFSLFKENISLNEKIKSLIELGNIVANLHDLGYAHRDIKPQNILIKDNKIKLSDYGLVWNEEYDGLTTSCEVVGPHLFIAPEMRQNVNIIKNPKPADVYSFGQVVWCMLKNEIKGIGETFDRKDPNLLLENIYVEDNFEPIYILLELSTQRNPALRPSIRRCIELLIDFYEMLMNNQKIIRKWEKIKIDNKISNNFVPNYEVYTEKTEIVDIINIIITNYIVEENPFTSEMVLEKCSVYKDGIVLRRIGIANSHIEYLCFPIRLVRLHIEGEMMYKLVIEGRKIDGDEYNEFTKESQKLVPIWNEERKTYININMELKFIPKSKL